MSGVQSQTTQHKKKQENAYHIIGERTSKKTLIVECPRCWNYETKSHKAVAVTMLNNVRENMLAINEKKTLQLRNRKY